MKRSLESKSPARAAAAASSSLADRARPWILAGTVALYVARPLWPTESVARTGEGLPVVMLWLLLLVAWLAAGAADRRLSIRIGWIDAALGALVLTTAVAAIYSALHDAARPAINMLWEWVGFGIGFWLIRQTLASAKEARAVVAVMLALATALAVDGLYQYAVTLPATRAEYLADPDKVLRAEGMNFPPGSVERELLEQRLKSSEPFATFALTNSLAGFLTPWLVAAAAIGALAAYAGLRSPRLFVAALASVGLVATCLVLTKSRAAYLATLAGLSLAALVFALSKARWNWRTALASFFVVLAMISLLIAVGLFVGGLDREVLSEAPKSFGYRLQYWQATWQMIQDHPWLGVGPGNFGDHYTRYKLPTASEEIADPHDFLFEIAATAGVFALVAMIAFVGLVKLDVFRALRERREAPNDDCSRDATLKVLVGAAAGLVVALVLPIATGTLVEAPLTAVVALEILVVAALMLWLWQPWIEHGSLPAWLPGVAALALLINLLVAGGIAFPGVAGSLWLLAALGANLCEPDARRVVTARAALAVPLVLAIAATAGCYVTGYNPVLRCQTELAAAQRDPAHVEEHLLAAAAADPWASQPWVALAEWRIRNLPRDPRNNQATRTAIYSALQRRPNQSSLRLRAGDYFLSFEQRARTRRERPRYPPLHAVFNYQKAIELYPNHALQHAKYALCLAAIGQDVMAQKQAATALELDRLTPHADQKLRPELRQELAAAGLIRR